MTNVTIRLMTEQESAKALIEAKMAFEGELRLAGVWGDGSAAAETKIDWAEYPAGSTPYMVEVDDRRVGILLLGMREEYGTPFGYIYGVYIDPDERGQGFGRGAIRLAEEQLISRGANEIRLRVWGENHAALRLYEQLGFKMTSMQMRKALP